MSNVHTTLSASYQPVTINTLQKMKAENKKWACVALYDAAMAAMASRVGIETVLVGDSVGMTVLGYDSTIAVTMENMIYHVEAVRRGHGHSLIVGDLPFMAYATPQQAMVNAARIMQAGAQMVKMEGGAWLAETIAMLSDRGIPVCAHLGLTPQSVHKLGGFRVQGRTKEQFDTILEDAQLLAQAGADLLVLECVPPVLAKAVTASIAIPTIGIGAGRDTDAQVLVINDILGMTKNPPKFAKNFLQGQQDIFGALQKYSMDVKAGLFPGEEHMFSQISHT
jgi:3-methyl-2-oxobutanoate hydroxymethyltransferase